MRFLGFLAALMAISPCTQAEVIRFTYTTSTLSLPPGYDTTQNGPVVEAFALPAFDPNLGTLTEASLRLIDGAIIRCRQATNTTGSILNYDSSLSGGMGLAGGPLSGSTAGPNTVGIAGFTVTPTSFVLNPGDTHVDCPGTIPINPQTPAILTTPSALGTLMGTTPVNFEARWFGSNSWTADPGVVVGQEMSFWGTFELRYVYTPSAPGSAITYWGSGDGGDQAGCTPCPCGNQADPGTLGGCLNSEGRSAQLIPLGDPSLSNDTLAFRVAGAKSISFAILISGDTLLPQNPANPCSGLGSGLTAANLDGLRVVGGAVIRHGGRATDSLGNIGFANAGWGPPNGPAGGLANQGGAVAGEQRFFQVFYRDAMDLNCMTGLNTSQAVGVAFAP